MPERCEQELCEKWSGDGNVCPCALFGTDPEFPCPNCRKADGVHARNCLTLLADQLDAQSGPDSHEWLGHDR